MERQIGPYRLEREVARGGMGLVYRALAHDGAPVALKLLAAGRHASPAQRQRFRREAEALQRLRHPGVVALLDQGEHQGAPWLALEWVEGETLEERLQQRGPLPVPEAVTLVRRLALALEHCHRRGVLHRDLKPANVLVRARRAHGAESDEPLLVDFGLARLLEDEAPDGPTRTGQLLGTPGWWAPEQAHGERLAVGPATDVHGLGALLHGALTGRPPMEGESLLAHLQALAGDPQPPSRLRPEVPPALDAVCLRCLARDPRQRYADAAGVALALGELLDAPRAAARAGRGAAWAGLAALALAALALGLVAFADRPRPAEGETVRPLPAPPAPEPGEPPEAALARIEELRRRGQVPQGLAAVASYLALHPDDPRAVLLRGELSALRDPEGQAAADLARWEQLVGREQAAQPQELRARLRLRRGDLEGAWAETEAALAQGGARAEMRVMRAWVLLNRGQAQEARAEAEAALREVPHLREARCLRAMLLAQQGDLAGAVAESDAIDRLDPLSVEELTTRSVWLLHLGRAQEGRVACERALAERPDGPRVLYNHARACLDCGDPTAALASAERALAGPGLPDPNYRRSVRWVRAKALGGLGRAPEAAAEARALLAEGGFDRASREEIEAFAAAQEARVAGG